MYQTIINILKKELVPAMGCTEPIAVAFCAAKCREILGTEPEEILIQASGNIIKNVKSVIVPHSNGAKGLETAACLGAFFGQADKKLEVISEVSDAESASLKGIMERVSCKVMPLESDHVLDLIIDMSAGEHKATVRLQDSHTNIVSVLKDGIEVEESVEDILNSEVAGVVCEQDNEKQDDLNYDILTVENIIDFASNVDLSLIQEVLDCQIENNMAIAEEGLKNDYGACIGKVMIRRGDSARNVAVAYAAAASDARMGGCNMPVVINSGSGNQGITCSVPVIIYARQYRKTQEELYRALLVSNLVTLHLKSGIGRLSAYCGAVSAGAGAGAGIAYLLTKSRKVVEHQIVNSIAITSGIVCDGAKGSCAAKIVMAVEAGILGFEMYDTGHQFRAGDGLVSKGVENTIRNISELGNDGMRETDKKIIEIMT